MTVPSWREREAADPVHPARQDDPRPPDTTTFGPVDVDPSALPAIAPERLEVTTAVGVTEATVTVRGELLQETAPLFLDAVADLADDESDRAVVVDLSGASFMDSTGLGTLVTLRNQVLVHGGRFVLVRPQDRVFRLFELTRLDTVFEFIDAR